MVTSASDRPRISLAGVRGDPGGAVAAALTRHLCATQECVPGARVRRAGKLDFGAVKAARVAGVLFGTVSTSVRGKRLELALLTTSLRPQRSWTIPLDRNGRLPAKALDALADDILDELAPSSVTVQAPRARGPSPGPSQRLAASGGARAGPPRSAPSIAAAVPPPPPRASPDPPAPRGPSGAAERFAAVDLGMNVTQRKLSYDGVGASGAPLQLVADGIVCPTASVELSPFAGVEDRWYAGAAAFASYARSVALETQEPGASTVRHATTLSRIEAGAGLRFRPVASARATVLARVSYRKLTVATKPAGGVALQGLPDADLAGPSFGLDLEAPFGSRYALLAGAAYTRWLRAKDLVGAGYFADGSAWALDANAGLSIGLRSSLSLRVLLDYGRTRYSLSGASPYSATGATDAYVGGRALVRVVF